ncbi:MAG: hypothetical protein AB8C84_13160 [Oligoflexales bacterium]
MTMRWDRFYDMAQADIQRVFDAVDDAVREDRRPRIVGNERQRPLRQKRKNRLDQVLVRCLVATHFRVDLLQKMRIKDMCFDSPEGPYLMLRWKNGQTDALKVEIDHELARLLMEWVSEYRRTARLNECVFTPGARRGRNLPENYISTVFQHWCREVGISLRELSGW